MDAAAAAANGSGGGGDDTNGASHEEISAVSINITSTLGHNHNNNNNNNQYLADQINGTCDFMDMIVYTVLETLQSKVSYETQTAARRLKASQSSIYTTGSPDSDLCTYLLPRTGFKMMV